MSELFEVNRGQCLQGDIIKIILLPECRESHRDTVKIRFDRMLQDGLVKEVEQLYNRGDLSASLPSMRMVGYRQVWRYLAGQLGYEEMQKHAIIATRQLAKRQVTWFRKEQNAEYINSQDAEKFSKVINYLIQNPGFSDFG